MTKEDETLKEEEGETPKETIAEKVKEVSLAQIPTEFGTVFRTPDGDMGQMEYLVWLGNMFLEFKAGIIGNK